MSFGIFIDIKIRCRPFRDDTVVHTVSKVATLFTHLQNHGKDRNWDGNSIRYDTTKMLLPNYGKICGFVSSLCVGVKSPKFRV